MSPRDHFAQAAKNPYFQSDAYKESKGGQYEDLVNKKIEKLSHILFHFWRGSNK
jgi:hypothetical protein